MNCHNAYISTGEDNASAKEPILICPICHGDMIHPTAVECHSPGTARGHVRIDCKGIHLDPTQAPMGRGVVITLQFRCESGHTFEYQMHFCKGTTFVERQMQALPNNVDPRPQTIWRD